MTKSAKQRAEIAIDVLKFFVGSSRWRTVVVILAFMLFFGWVTSSTYDVLILLLKSMLHLEEWAIHLSFLVFFVVFFLLLTFYARSSSQEIKVRVYPDDEPTKVKGLILFLSPNSFKQNA